jgi:Ser/Thr protein kinase RdoA (MazF antagonist)
MKYEPPTINRTLLIETLGREYDLIIECLDFVPLGEVACSYIVYVKNGERYFLKLYTDTRAGRIFSSRLNFYLPLCQQLKKEGVVERLPCAVATVRGELKIQLASGDTLVLFDFIDGPNVGCEAPMSDELFAQLAALFGRFHVHGATLVHESGRVEKYEVPFADGMKKAFADLRAVDQHARPGRIALRKMLEPHTDEVLGYLKRLLELQETVRSLGTQNVLCHTDLHGDNLIVDAGGHLYALDWEGALLAPAEHDLFMYIGDERFARL